MHFRIGILIMYISYCIIITNIIYFLKIIVILFNNAYYYIIIFNKIKIVKYNKK
jgi:hypothetical protein